MNRRNCFVAGVTVSAAIVLVTFPITMYGQGSIAFNGTYYSSPSITAGTSKLENTSADVLNSTRQITVCCWIYKSGPGEGGIGTILCLDELNGNASFVIRQDGNTRIRIIKNPGASGTQGVWDSTIVEGAWNALCVKFDFSSDSNDPVVRVNHTTSTLTEMTAPSGIDDLPATGYCVGNDSAQTRTWDGRIAHVQVFNTILNNADADAALRNPGSVTSGLRLYLPMRKASDVSDHSGNSFHGTGTDLVDDSNFPPARSIFDFGVANETLYQIVIPSNGSEPSEGVRGLGTRTKLTASNSLSGGTHFVTTEGWNTTNTVIEPTVRDIYVVGDQDIPDHPFSNGTELALGDNPVCHAIAIDGDAGTVSDCKVFDFRGNGIWVKNNTQEFSRMIRMPRVINNKISHCWTGIRAQAVDTQISGNRVANVRDIGIRCLGGSEQLSGNHSFGAQVAISAEGGHVQSVNDRFADAPIGFQLLSNAANSIIEGGISIRCWKQSILSEADRVRISNCFIDVSNTDDARAGDALATYGVGTLTSSGMSGTTVTLTGGTWPTWVAGETIVCDGQTRRIATRDSNTQVTLTAAPSSAWSNDTYSTTRRRIVGVWLGGNQNVLENSYVRLGTHTFGSSQNTRGSVGVFVEANNARVEALRVQGSAQAGEVGCLVKAAIDPVYIEIDSTGAAGGGTIGFKETGDAVLEFEDKNAQGLCYVTYSANEIPVRIPTGWGTGGKLRIYTRVQGSGITTGTWSELTAEQSYP